MTDEVERKAAGLEEVERTIERLREHFRAETDADLARRLRIDKSTVSSWRARGRVPDRFLKMLEGASHQAVGAAPLHWGDHEHAAFQLALFRYARLVSDTVASGDYRSNIDLLMKAETDFWILMNAAQMDIAERPANNPYDPSTAAMLIVHDDLAAGSASIERDRALTRARGVRVRESDAASE